MTFRSTLALILKYTMSGVMSGAWHMETDTGIRLEILGGRIFRGPNFSGGVIFWGKYF